MALPRSRGHSVPIGREVLFPRHGARCRVPEKGAGVSRGQPGPGSWGVGEPTRKGDRRARRRRRRASAGTSADLVSRMSSEEAGNLRRKKVKRLPVTGVNCWENTAISRGSGRGPWVSGTSEPAWVTFCSDAQRSRCRKQVARFTRGCGQVAALKGQERRAAATALGTELASGEEEGRGEGGQKRAHGGVSLWSENRLGRLPGPIPGFCSPWDGGGVLGGFEGLDFGSRVPGWVPVSAFLTQAEHPIEFCPRA